MNREKKNRTASETSRNENRNLDELRRKTNQPGGSIKGGRLSDEDDRNELTRNKERGGSKKSP